MNDEMVTYTVTLHTDGAITYTEPVEIKWVTNEQ
jgi:hypothetical protein